MAKQDKLTPFIENFGNAVGRGKDNVVVEFKKSTINRIDNIVKWNHDLSIPITNEEHFKRILYKKKKYEILKMFLGDFIPESSFVLGNKQDASKIKTKEYTIQNRVPQFSISSLPKEIKDNPILIHNIHLLILKLQQMYKILNLVNSSVEEDSQLDGKLDLGGLSKFAETNPDILSKSNDLSNILEYDFFKTPNLLVDPNSMQLSCVDFDQGVWSDEKEASLILLRTLINNNQELMKLFSRKQKINQNKS
ncbi:MAG: hypothetical protein WC850_00875 [Candidatus Gracilibacteria bacterium]